MLQHYPNQPVDSFSQQKKNTSILIDRFMAKKFQKKTDFLRFNAIQYFDICLNVCKWKYYKNVHTIVAMNFQTFYCSTEFIVCILRTFGAFCLLCLCFKCVWVCESWVNPKWRLKLGLPDENRSHSIWARFFVWFEQKNSNSFNIHFSEQSGSYK